jgi:hypothetical protein
VRIKPGDLVMGVHNRFWSSTPLEPVVVLTVHMGGHQYDRSLQAECLDSSGKVTVVDCSQLVVVGSATRKGADEDR